MTRRRHQRRRPSPLPTSDGALAKATILVGTRGEDPLAPVEIDQFKRVERLYAATFDTWEDFDPYSR
jgi:hypothetical protein